MNPTPWSASVGFSSSNPVDVHEADVVIVGGGITGLTTAYLLLAAGRQVVVLERDELGQGEIPSR